MKSGDDADCDHEGANVKVRGRRSLGTEREAPGRNQPAQAVGPVGLEAGVGALLRSGAAGGVQAGVTPAQLQFLQRTAGNHAVGRLVGPSPLTVQRKSPSLSAIKRAAGRAVRGPSTAEKAARAGTKAGSAKIVTLSELEKQIATLESASRKLSRKHQPGNTESQNAASKVHEAAERILGNLPDQDSKASKVLGRTYPNQVRRLRRVIDDTQLILDEVRVANTRREAQNIYMEAGRTETKGQKGALTKLTVRNVFDQTSAPPAPNAQVLAYLKEHGFGTYEEAFDDALANSAGDPKSDVEMRLEGLQPQLFKSTEKSRSRTSALTMGLSAAELAAIQVYSAQDYRYINPATANDAGWMAANYSDLADKPNKTEEEWAELQDQLAASGQTLDQRMTDRRKDLTNLREEGGLHTGMALGGLAKMPVWKGNAYRGQRMQAKRFYPQFVKDGDGFRPRNPTFTWKTITSISKSESSARSFAFMGEGSYIVVFEFEVTNGRDIEGLSVNRREREVALLPGAEFAYGDVEVVKPGKHVEGFGEVPWQLKIKARQVK